MKDMKKQNPRFKDDALDKLVEPDINKIKCKDCLWREKDRFNGKVKGATLGSCRAYAVKPNEVIWKNQDCPCYKSENDSEDD